MIRTAWGQPITITAWFPPAMVVEAIRPDGLKRRYALHTLKADGGRAEIMAAIEKVDHEPSPRKE